MMIPDVMAGASLRQRSPWSGRSRLRGLLRSLFLLLQPGLHLHQLLHHPLVLLPLAIQIRLLGLYFPLLLALIALEQPDAVDALHEDQQKEWQEDAQNVAGGGFQELEEIAHAGQALLVLAQHIGIRHRHLVVGM